MTPNFKLSPGSYEVFKFSSGEVQVKLTYLVQVPYVLITGSILTSDHLMELLQLVEAVRYANGNVEIDMQMPYCAYSRQDRRCNYGESFSLKVFTDLINSCKFSKIHTRDNHSLVATGLLNNCMDIPVSTNLFAIEIQSYDYLISPDAGSNKKVFDASQMHQVPMIRADKHRDTKTGDITHTEVFTASNIIRGKKLLIVDDICANGRTFLELTKAIKKIEPDCTIHLYITHAFFGIGLDAMKKAGISKFITTDSVCTITDPDLTIINL